MEIPFTIPSSTSLPLCGCPHTVTDGDDVRFYITVRIFGIDAPEAAQTYGEQAKMELEHIIVDAMSRNKTVRARLIIKGVDKFGRLLAQVLIGSTDVGKEMVLSGHAWSDHYYLAEEQIARTERRGLWADTNPENPGLYKKRHGNNQSPTR